LLSRQCQCRPSRSRSQSRREISTKTRESTNHNLHIEDRPPPPPPASMGQVRQQAHSHQMVREGKPTPRLPSSSIPTYILDLWFRDLLLLHRRHSCPTTATMLLTFHSHTRGPLRRLRLPNLRNHRPPTQPLHHCYHQHTRHPFLHKAGLPIMPYRPLLKGRARTLILTCLLEHHHRCSLPQPSPRTRLRDPPDLHLRR
jgi:hypothetical protein